jgi:GAF domain-containing protein
MSASLCASFNAHESAAMQTDSDFVQSIDEAARTINEPRNLDETLQTIVEVACNSVPGFDQVGIATVQKRGKIATRAFTGDLVLHLDQVQYSLGEGPCSAALQGNDTVCVSSLHSERRWPRYVPQAREAGVRSQMAVKLYLDGDTLGGINFYSTAGDDVNYEAQALGRLFGTHAAIALGHAHEREGLNQAIQSRQVIGQAIGIVMERYAIPEDHAFAFLVRASSHRNMKLRDVAQQLVDHFNGK